MKLFWKDNTNNKYFLGSLYKDNGYYYFKVNQEGFLSAVSHGCFGIGTIDPSVEIHKSKTLFSFFQNRIPSKENPDIKKILASLELDEYDEYEVLRRIHGRLLTDNYYLE